MNAKPTPNDSNETTIDTDERVKQINGPVADSTCGDRGNVQSRTTKTPKAGVERQRVVSRL